MPLMEANVEYAEMYTPHPTHSQMKTQENMAKG